MAVEAWTPPGRVWPWVLALPAGRAVPRLDRRIQFIHQAAMAGTARAQTGTGEVLLGGLGDPSSLLPSTALPTQKGVLSTA